MAKLFHNLFYFSAKTLVLLLILFPLKSFSQTGSKAWLDTIDTHSFRVYKNKNKVPEEFLKALDIESKRKIANPYGHFRKGCTGFGKSRRLNWIAKDKNNHSIISISHGGRSYGTEYYYCEITENKVCLYGLLKITVDPMSFYKVIEMRD